jgi:DNA-binding CsgD family transcriptional regulator
VPNFDRQFGELWKAALLLAEGNQGGAEDLAHAVLARTGRAGHVMVAAPCLDLLAAIAAERESCLEAARLLGASNAMCERLGLVSWRPPFAQWRVRTIDQLRGVVGEEAFQRAFDEGAALSLEDAVAYARRGRGERKRPSFGWESLTPAESQVVELVTEGLSNAQIATRLFKSERTVATQLSSVFGKLAVSSRTELTAAAAARRRRD